MRLSEFHLDTIRFGCGASGEVICGIIMRLVNENSQLKKEIEEKDKEIEKLKKIKTEKKTKKTANKKAENNSSEKADSHVKKGEKSR